MCVAINKDLTGLLAYSIYNSLYNFPSNNKLISHNEGIISSNNKLNAF